MNLWELIKKFYKQKYGYSDSLIEYIAVRPIIIKSLSGESNITISLNTEYKAKEVEEILTNVLGFHGWEKDLEINFLAMYNNCGRNPAKFRESILSAGIDVPVENTDTLFELMERFAFWERTMKDFYV